MATADPSQRRQRLSFERVLDAAISLARTDGLSGVSMPSVSRSLGTTPMSLYRYVENKDALILGMLTRATSMVEVPPSHDDPTTEIMVVFEAVHDMLRQDPWTVQHFMQGYRGEEPVRALVSRSLLALSSLGLEQNDAWQAHQALLNYTYGEVLAAETSTRNGLDYGITEEVPTDADMTISEFEGAADRDQSSQRYRATLQRYLRSIVDEVGSD